MDYRIEQLRYLLREDPSSRIFYQLGELLRREGQVEEAVTVLTSGLDRHPRYVAAWVSLGRSLVDRSDLNDAEEAFKKALEIDPENAVAARLLGETAAGREDWLPAVKALKLARALTGSDDALDARISEVEEHLADRGELEAPPEPEPPAVQPSPRSLEVVSLSQDDPFAADAAEVDSWDSKSDVFEIIEPLAAEIEAAEEETPAPEPPAEESAQADEPGVESSGDELDEVEAVAVADEAPPVKETAAVVDEGSIGAWSSSRGGGVPIGEAWLAPTADLDVEGPRFQGDSPWLEPDAEIVDEPEPVPESEPEPEPELPSVDEVPEAEPADEEPEIDADDVLPGEDRGFEGDSLTRPIPVAALVPPGQPPPETESESVETEADAVEDDRDDDSGHGVPLPTMTLARLALEQGDRALSVATLESLIERDPGHAEALAMLEELRTQDAAQARQRARAESALVKATALQGWLDAVRLASERRLQ